ncbi:MAG: hypothetical protein ACREJC_10730 [Tepidisphaeraceae bacterium]
MRALTPWDYEQIAAYHRADRWRRMTPAQRVLDRGRDRDEALTHARENERVTRDARAYGPSPDAEARWLRDRDLPGAFDAAKAKHRRTVLARRETCLACGGNGFCQCDPTLTATDLQDAGGYHGPEFD